MNKKIIFSLLAVILVAGSVYFINSKKAEPVDTPLITSEQPGEQIVQNAQSTSTAPTTPTTSEKEAIKNMAWSLFQKYLSYNKESNLAGVKSSVYKISEVCNMETPNQECKDRMQSAYSYGSVLKSQEFKNVWYDEKQIIISTDFWTENSPEVGAYGRFRAIIFFVKDQSGNWKMLSFSPFKGSITSTKEFKEGAEAQAKIQSDDLDMDGLADFDEECKDGNRACLKTDPKKRDTDGNGLWDGVEALM